MADTSTALPSFLSDVRWSSGRPRALVVCCSDGRLQRSIDDFLGRRLGVVDYDRLHAPGGPAVLSDAGAEYVRANVYRREMEFLFRAHRIEQVLLIFHGAADDGPEEGGCAHYRRLLPGGTHADTARRQATDAVEVCRHLAAVAPGLDVQVFRAEVQADLRVKFLTLAGPRWA
jgi:hypothetical protein